MSRLRVRELTPPGRGGVAVLQVEGPGALERVRDLAPDARLERGAPCFARLATAGEGLDEALVVVHGPRHLELHLHGSPPLVRRVAEQLGAAPAELTATLEERAAELLADAPCEAAARILLDQLEGALRRELEQLARLDRAAGSARLELLLERARIAGPALRPGRVVLAGPVNAGKSTLFNALVGRRRVVTSAERGTTRDAIRELVLLGAWPVELIDTAGERELSEGGAPALERAGQALGRELRASADLILWLSPDGAPPPADGHRAVPLHTCSDRLEPAARGPRTLSALLDPDGAAEVVARAFRQALDLPADPWSPGQAVPFEPDLARRLAALVPLAAAERRTRLEDLL